MSDQEDRRTLPAANGNQFAFPELILPSDSGRFGNRRLRFTILFAALSWTVASCPIWLSIVIPRQVVTVHCVVLGAFIGLWAIVMVVACGNYFLLNKMPMVPWDETFDLRKRTFKHIVIVPCYLEPSEVIHDCLDTLTFQARPECLVVVVSFDSCSPNLSQKVARVRQEYKDKFGDFLIVIHELQSEHECPGSCSNKNFALREAYKYCQSRHGSGFKLEKYTVTHSNTDCKFHPRYFESLEAAYNLENQYEGSKATMCVWQPAQFFNWGLEQRSFITRDWRLLHSCLILGANIGFNLHPDGVYSYPLELGFAANFINPRYVGSDIIAQARWMCYTNSFVPVRPLGVPVLRYSGVRSTSKELREWASEAADSISAVSESFHYFLIHWRGRPFCRGLLWLVLFSLVKGFLLCSGPIYLACAMIPYPWLTDDDYPSLMLAHEMHLPTYYLPHAALVVLLVLFTVPFLLDASLARWLGIVEDIHPLSTFVNWVGLPIVLLIQSLVTLAYVAYFAVDGRAPTQRLSSDASAPQNLLTQQLLTQDDTVQYSATAGRPAEKYRNSSVSKVAGKSVTASRADGDDGKIYV